MQSDPVVSLTEGYNPKRLDIKHRYFEIGSIADLKRKSSDWQGAGERRDRQVDVVAAVQVRTVRSIDFTPSTTPVGTEPEIWIVEVAEQ
jgi:hypothetical protein